MACALAVLLTAKGGRAQMAAEAAPGTTPGTTEDALRAMAQRAAVIFAGQVVAVRRLNGMDGATGIVEIEFAVDDAVRGISGSTYTLREWAGLWAGGDQPLRAGQRFLMLLHAPSAAGLSSPVGGMDGTIPIRGGRPLARVAGIATAVDRRTMDLRAVDLRWVATRVVRPVSYRSESVAHPTSQSLPVQAEAVAAVPAQGTEAAGGSQTSDGAAALRVEPAIAATAQDAGYATVLALLRSWEKSSDAAR
jgi:hypothetical protein